jgi:uncharacterized protein YuzE
MEFKYDPQADAIYIYLSEKPYAYGRDLDDERRIDYASDNSPIGVELLCVSKGVNVGSLPRKDEIAEILEANRIKTYIMEGYPMAEGVIFNVDLASLKTEETEKLTTRLAEKEEVTV